MKIEKIEKLVAKLNDIYMRNLKQALNYELILTKVHRAIKFNQKAWLKPHFDPNTELGKNSKK